MLIQIITLLVLLDSKQWNDREHVHIFIAKEYYQKSLAHSLG